MIHRPELLTALENAPTGSRCLTAWRHMFGGHPPDQENNRGARWNPPGVAAIYLSEERSGAIAEGNHAILVQPYRPRARRWIYSITVTLENVVDISAIQDLNATGWPRSRDSPQIRSSEFPTLDRA
jgi:RES domain-containing protein